ncbi:MAG: glyoxylate/hydroxypyruvate reductase A [Balneolaceae bacterium]
MSLLLVAQRRNMEPFKAAILEVDPNIDVDIWPSVKHPDRVQFAVAWNHPAGIFKNYPNLKVISSLGAGVDHLMSDDSIPSDIRITRVIVPSLSDQMSDYVLTAVLNLFRKTEQYIHQQKSVEWSAIKAFDKSELTIGVMGLGELGSNAAHRLHINGFNVIGWSRSQKEIQGVQTFMSGKLKEFLNRSNILVNLLPLTRETDGILDLDLFKELNQPAYLINVARGEHLVEEDLIYALNTNLISHAVLDVFKDEPLPESHPFWGSKKITITPHIASITDPADVAVLLAENYKRALSGLDLINEVDKEKGY